MGKEKSHLIKGPCDQVRKNKDKDRPLASEPLDEYSDQNPVPGPSVCAGGRSNYG